jgi:hypothetical protein
MLPFADFVHRIDADQTFRFQLDKPFSGAAADQLVIRVLRL